MKVLNGEKKRVKYLIRKRKKVVECIKWRKKVVKIRNMSSWFGQAKKKNVLA